jgi:hypothetical protein
MDKKPDIIISVSGGLVSGIFGDSKLKILLVDFDNFENGETEFDPHHFFGPDGPVDGEAAQSEIRDALEQVEKNKQYTKEMET